MVLDKKVSQVADIVSESFLMVKVSRFFCFLNLWGLNLIFLGKIIFQVVESLSIEHTTILIHKIIIRDKNHHALYMSSILNTLITL